MKVSKKDRGKLWDSREIPKPLREVLRNIAKCSEARQYDNAQRLIDKFFPSNKDVAPLMHLQAMVFTACKRFNQALFLYDELVERYPNRTDLREERAVCRLKTKKPDLALQDFRFLAVSCG